MARKDIINTDGSIEWDVIGEFVEKLTILTSIASIPTRVGQIAVVNGIGYIAVGTSSTADWKQMTL